MNSKAKFLTLGLLSLIACSKSLQVECSKPILPEKPAIVEYYETQFAETLPAFTEPTPHELIDLIAYMKKLEVEYQP